jgi:ketosteroid isomerase-like protein
VTPTPDPTMQILDAYKAAVYAKDVDAFVALYDADVRVFDMWGAWSHDGLDAWRRMAAGWFGSLGDERVAVEFAEVESVAGVDLVAAQAFVTYAAIGADGAPLRALTNRMTMTLRQRDGAWKIVHEHSSSPLDVSTAKPMFTRG